MKKRIISLLLVCLMVFSLLPTAVFAADLGNPEEWDTLVITKADGTEAVKGTDYSVTTDYYNYINDKIPYHVYTLLTGDLVISGGAVYTDPGASSAPQKSKVNISPNVENANITLNNVTALASISVAAGKSASFTLVGENHVDSIIGGDATGNTGATLTFGGEGTLVANHIGGDSKYGGNILCPKLIINGGNYVINGGYDSFSCPSGYVAGIGGGQYCNVDGITINGGTISVQSNYGAAIGGGQNGYAKNITINGGTINAKGSYGAAIGGGQNGIGEAIIISDGTLVLKTSRGGIGGGQNADGKNISITGGDITIIDGAGGGALIGGGQNANAEGISITGGKLRLETKHQSANKEYWNVGIGAGSNSANANTTASNITISDTDIAIKINPTTASMQNKGYGYAVGTPNASTNATSVSMNCGVYNGNKLPDDYHAEGYSSYLLSNYTYIIGKTDDNMTITDGKVVKGTFAFDVTEYASDTSTVTNEDGVWTVTPPKVDIGEGESAITAEVIVEQKSEVDMTGEELAEEIRELDDTTKNAITTNTSVSGVNLTTEVAAEAPVGTKSGLQAVVDAAVSKAGSGIADAIKTAETVNVEVKVNVVPTEFKETVAATETTPEVIGTVTFELKPTATVIVGTGEGAKSETVDVGNDMIDTTKPITVSIYTGFEPVKIVHKGENGFEEVFRKTGDKTFTYANGVCTLTISHFSELTAVAKVYVAQTGVENQYETLQDAVNAAGTNSLGTTITLLDDVVLTTGVNVPENKNITVTGQNHTITIDASASQYVFGNGTVSTEGLKGASELTVNNVNFVSSTKGQNYGVITGSGFDGKVELNNCSFKNLYTGLYMNHNVTADGSEEAEISIKDCTYTDTTWGYSVDSLYGEANVKVAFTGNKGLESGHELEIFPATSAIIKKEGYAPKQYQTLEAAVNGAAANDTITLVKDVTGPVTINKAITLDGNGFKITADNADAITVTVGGVTLKNVKAESKKWHALVVGVKNGNDAITPVEGDITINGGEYKSGIDNTAVQGEGAVRIFANGKVSIKNAAMTGGIHVFEPASYEITGNTIGFTFEGDTPFVGILIQKAAGTDNSSAKLAADNTITMPNKTSYYVQVGNWGSSGIQVVDPVAKVNGSTCLTLDEAIQHSGNNDVIELVKDVTIAAPVNVTKAVSIDGKDFTLTLSSGNAIFNAKNNVNNDGISNSLTVTNLKMVMNSDSNAQNGYAVIAGKGASGFAISFENCSFKNMWCGAMLNGCGTGTVAPAVTIKNSTFENVAHGVSFAFADYAGKVTFTGNKMRGETDIQEVFTTEGYVKAPTVKVTDGYYTADPSKYVASGCAVAGSDIQGYAYMVTKVELPAGGNSDVGVASEKPKVNCGDRINPDYETTVQTAAAKTEVAGLGTDALTEAAKVDANDAKTALTDASVNVAEATVTVFAQTYLNVEPQAYNASEGAEVYTVDITPMVQLIATTAEKAEDIKTENETGKNAVKLGEPTKLEVTTPVVVTIPLPADFAIEGRTLFVKHTKNSGASYLYKCTVQKDASEQLYIQFVNNNGFSEFEITTVDTSVASIEKGGSTLYYTSLSAAVAAVKDGETITLTQTCGETVTVGRDVSFTLNKNGKSFNGDIVAGANTTRTIDGSVYTFDYTAPTPINPPTPVQYSIDAPSNIQNGSVMVNKVRATVGSLVTITVSPDEGYKLDTLTVKDTKGNVLALTKVNDTTYTFKMPSGKVTISATFKEIVDSTVCPQDATCVYAKFTDADTKAWYHDGVHFCVENGYMQGVSATAFDPAGTTTRAMIVTMLWRMEGEPVANYAMTFKDVKADQWYTEAIRWAQSTGIVEGYSAEAFGPDDPITREQMATILYRYAKYHEIDMKNTNTLAGFTDVNKVSTWALDAMKWANAVGLVQGRTTTTLVPEVSITRAEAATMVQRYCENVSKD